MTELSSVFGHGTSGTSGTSGIGSSGSSGTSGTGAATTLNGLTDVSAASPADGQILVYDSTSSTWINQENVSGVSDPLTIGTVTVTTSLTASTKLTIPTSQPGSLTAGDIWIE